MEFADKSVVERGLVSSTPKIKDIVKEHTLYFDRDAEVTNFEGETLAYITPVNLYFNFIAGHSCSLISSCFVYFLK